MYKIKLSFHDRRQIYENNLIKTAVHTKQPKQMGDF